MRGWRYGQRDDSREAVAIDSGTILRVLVAVAIGLSILLLGRWGVRVLATGGPPDIDPTAVVDVEIKYECVVCGLRLTVTQAQDEEVSAPRHCMEPMERITAASDL